MKLIASIFLFLCIMGNNNPEFVNGKRFKGYIFSKEHFVLISIENQLERYTPNKEEVFFAENLIKNKIESLNKQLLNQGGNCPIIHKNLKKYVRQYVGFINKDGEKVIWVNFIWNDKQKINDISKNIVFYNDGCSHYWSLKVNLNKHEIFELRINGSA